MYVEVDATLCADVEGFGQPGARLLGSILEGWFRSLRRLLGFFSLDGELFATRRRQ